MFSAGCRYWRERSGEKYTASDGDEIEQGEKWRNDAQLPDEATQAKTWQTVLAKTRGMSSHSDIPPKTIASTGTHHS